MAEAAPSDVWEEEYGEQSRAQYSEGDTFLIMRVAPRRQIRQFGQTDITFLGRLRNAALSPCLMQILTHLLPDTLGLSFMSLCANTD